MIEARPFLSLIAALALGACVAHHAPPVATPAAAAGPPGEVVAVAVEGDRATCSSGQSCALSCPEGDCDLDCASGSTCQASCDGGNCAMHCAAGATCTFSCNGGDCEQACGGATCASTCEGECTVVGVGLTTPPVPAEDADGE